MVSVHTLTSSIFVGPHIDKVQGVIIISIDDWLSLSKAEQQFNSQHHRYHAMHIFS